MQVSTISDIVRPLVAVPAGSFFFCRAKRGSKTKRDMTVWMKSKVLHAGACAFTHVHARTLTVVNGKPSLRTLNSLRVVGLSTAIARVCLCADSSDSLTPSRTWERDSSPMPVHVVQLPVTYIKQRWTIFVGYGRKSSMNAFCGRQKKKKITMISLLIATKN